MRKLWITLALAAACFCNRGQTTNAPVTLTLLPEGLPFTVAWEQEVEEASVTTYRLWSGTNLVQTLGTNDVRVLAPAAGGANLTTTLMAVVAGMARGTNVLSLTAVVTLGTNVFESERSMPLVVRALGKPSAPQAIRKL